MRVGGSMYKSYGSYWQPKNGYRSQMNKQTVANYDAQVLGLGDNLFGTLQDATITSIQNAAKQMISRRTAEQVAKMSALQDDLASLKSGGILA